MSAVTAALEQERRRAAPPCPVDIVIPEPERSTPEPLRRKTAAAMPYPQPELGPILGAAAMRLQEVIQAPDAVCCASVLAVASLSTQGLANVSMDGRTIPLSLWLLTCAESGERKSAVDVQAMASVREWERNAREHYDAEMLAFSAQMEERKAARDQAKTKAKGAGLAEALMTLGPDPLPPLRPLTTMADFTAEGLAKLLPCNRPSVGIFSDEAAVVFGGHGMSREAVTRTAGTLCKLWDSGSMDRVRAGDGASRLYGKRLAMHLLAQPVIVERVLSDELLSGQGFLARCLLAWPQSTAGTRMYRAESLATDPAMVRMHARVNELMNLPLPMADSADAELAPRDLTLTADAKAKWIKFHDAVEQQVASGGMFANVKPWASKAAEQALRIAGVLAIFDDPTTQTIDLQTLDRGASLATWHLREAARLASVAAVPVDVRNAELLLDWCAATSRRLLCSSDALQRGPTRIRDRETFLRAVGELERAGWAEPVPEGAVIEGKHRRHVWNMALDHIEGRHELA